MTFLSSDPESAGRPVDTADGEARVGEQIRALRLDASLDQATLAALADVSLSALKNLENGRGSTLRTLIRILRALGRDEWLTTLAPGPTISPIDVLRSASTTPRRRVYRRRSGD
jgi:transcriptional regulator with XRE-family HTH domain